MKSNKKETETKNLQQLISKQKRRNMKKIKTQPLATKIKKIQRLKKKGKISKKTKK